jgi:PGF-pre-PGF domain-containing protein
MNKIVKNYSGFLVLIVVVGILIATLGSDVSEKNKTSDNPENAGTKNEVSAYPKSGLAPKNPEFVKYQTNKIISQAVISQKERKKGFVPEFLDLYFRLSNDINKYEINEVTTSSNSSPVLENPEFIKYQTNNNLSQTASSRKKYKTGFIPAPVDLHHLSKVSAAELSSPDNYGQQDAQTIRKFSSNQTELYTPAYYDLRALNKVTNVKDQGDLGDCWAFATYASLESYLMPQENWIFSENNMKNLLSSTYPEGFDLNTSDGGNEFMSTAYLARWSGPVNESDDPYSPNSVLSPHNLSIQKHIQNVLYLPDRQGSLDNQEIKWAIQNDGAVFTTMYCDPTFYSPSTYSYYYNETLNNNRTSDNNHAVAIVGWNNSYDQNLFSNVPPGNGAFIVKNDWGTDWGDKGYFYISYYDSNIGKDNSIFTAESPDNYKYIYQYDPLGWTANYGFYSLTGWCANIFTTKSSEVLKAVSFYTTDSNCNYEIFIYINPKSKPVNQAGLVFAQSGMSKIAGYHTVPLSSGIQLKAGQKFSVVLKLTNPENDDQNNKYPIAVEEPVDGYSIKATANPGESFVSPDGKTWTDMTSSLLNTSVCIKAFTIPRSVFPIANFSADPTSGNSPLTVQFTDLSENEASISWDFGDGTNSTEQNPGHTYSTAGNYTVNLTVSNKNSTDSTVTTITVKEYKVLPVANFDANPTSGYAPLTVQFTDSSQNAAGWNWDFGDGATSNDQSPSHAYSTEGTYKVNLVVSNANETASKAGTITVQSESSSISGSSDGSSSSGGSGGGGSSEPQTNVVVKELSQAFISSGQPVKFDFPQKATSVVNISFDSKKTVLKTTTIVEMLNGKSTLVSGLPSNEVYKFLNIWVGNSGFATPENIENAVVCFKVEKSWVQEKKIDKSSITLNRYSDNAWNQLPTSLLNEDDNYLYFTAQTPGFSPFAITGKIAATVQPAVDKTQTENNSGSTAVNTEQTPQELESQSPSQKQSTSTPGFELISGIAGLLAVFLYRRKHE